MKAPLALAATALGWFAVAQIRRSSCRLSGLGLALFAGLLFPLLTFDIAVALPIISRLRNEGLNYPGPGPRPVQAILALLRLFALAALPLANALFIRALWRRLTGTGSSARLFTLSGIATAVTMLFAGLNWVNTPPSRSSLRGVTYGDEAAVVAAANSSPHSRPERVRSVPDGPWVAQLPDGGSMELLAVRLHPADGQPWLRPDGTPSDYDAKIGRESPANSDGAVLALARLHWIDQPPSWPNPDGSPGIVYSSLKNRIGFASRDGQRLPMADFGLMEFPLDSVTSIQSGETTLRLGVATAGWQTLASQEPGRWKDITADTNSARREWSFSETANGSLQVTITHLIMSPTMQYRLIAVDLDGVEHPETRIEQRLWITDKSVTYTAGFDLKGGKPLPLRRVLAVLLQGRPYEAVEFRHVSLRADHRSTVEIQDFAKPERSSAPPPAPEPVTPERLDAAIKAVEAFGGGVVRDASGRIDKVHLIYARHDAADNPYGDSLNANTTDAIREWLPAFQDARQLMLYRGQATDRAMPFVARMPHLATLGISYAEELTDAGVLALAPLVHLRQLYFAECPRLTDAALPVLRKFPELEKLILDGTALTDAGLEQLQLLPRLRTLNIGQTRVTPAGVEKLRRARPDLDVQADWAPQTDSKPGGPAGEPHPAAVVPASSPAPATATLVPAYEQDLRWRWRVAKNEAGRIRFGIADSDADGVLGTICPHQLTDRSDQQTHSPPPADLVLTVTKAADRTTLSIADEFFPPVPGAPQQLSAIIPKETWREIACQRVPVALSFTSYQTLWEADVVRHSADGAFTAHRRLRFIARMIGPDEPEDLQMLGDNDPVKTILPIVTAVASIASP